VELSAQSQVVPVPTEVAVIGDDFDLSAISTADLIFAVSALVASLVLSRLAKRALRRVFAGIEGMPELAGDVITRIVGYVILTFGLVLALEAVGFSLGLVGTLLLLAIVGLVLAAKPLLQDLGAGLILQMRRPFTVGDQVQIDGCEGAVVEISARTLRLNTVDGRRIHLPNRTALDGAIVNLTVGGQRLSTFVAGVAYDTDLDRAKQVVVEALVGAPSVLSDPVPEAFVEEFSDSTINIACRFWHQPEIQAEWAARDEAMRAVKRAFDANGITIAFPQRVHWRADEVLAG
jgi:small conductance mechanosensitive channel